MLVITEKSFERLQNPCRFFIPLKNKHMWISYLLWTLAEYSGNELINNFIDKFSGEHAYAIFTL